MTAMSVKYIYYGKRAPECGDAMLIGEVEDGLLIFWWTGYPKHSSVKLYPRCFAAKYYDTKPRRPFVMPMRDIVFKTSE